MRIETDYNIFTYLLIVLFVVLALSKTSIPRKPYKILLALAVAVILPSFVPGHGEIVMLIPSGVLFAVASSEAKAIGVLFTLINYFIAWFIFYRVCGLFKGRT